VQSDPWRKAATVVLQGSRHLAQTLTSKVMFPAISGTMGCRQSVQAVTALGLALLSGVHTQSVVVQVVKPRKGEQTVVQLPNWRGWRSLEVRLRIFSAPLKTERRESKMKYAYCD